MDWKDLKFEQADILGRLQRWVEIESPTFWPDAVNKAMDEAQHDIAVIGADIRRMPGRDGYGDCVYADFDHRRDEPGILVLGHLDTVHPLGTLKLMGCRCNDGLLVGPGALDMKGGVCIALEAIRAIKLAGLATPLPVRMLLTGDEEVGSPSTRELIEAEARRNRVVLVPEPARADGGVVTGRYAIARYRLDAFGASSHAGREPEKGRSAIRRIADIVAGIEDMTSDRGTFSVGVISGGQWVNCVARHCHAEVLCMAKTEDDLDAATQRLQALAGTHNGVELTVTRTATRPIWTPRIDGFPYNLARRLAAEIGLPLTEWSAGGGSDGNFTGALGVPTLDGLGVLGSGPHTLSESVEIESLVPRSRLLAGLLLELA